MNRTIIAESISDDRLKKYHICERQELKAVDLTDDDSLNDSSNDKQDNEHDASDIDVLTEVMKEDDAWWISLRWDMTVVIS